MRPGEGEARGGTAALPAATFAGGLDSAAGIAPARCAMSPGGCGRGVPPPRPRPDVFAPTAIRDAATGSPRRAMAARTTRDRPSEPRAGRSKAAAAVRSATSATAAAANFALQAGSARSRGRPLHPRHRGSGPPPGVDRRRTRLCVRDQRRLPSRSGIRRGLGEGRRPPCHEPAAERRHGPPEARGIAPAGRAQDPRPAVPPPRALARVPQPCAAAAASSPAAARRRWVASAWPTTWSMLKYW